TDFSVCVPKTIDVEDTSFEITVTTYYDCYYDYDTEFTIRKGVGENEDPIVVEVDNPYDNPDFRLDKFSIEGFAFTGELGEQEIKVTYLGKEFTFTVRIVNEDEEEQGFKWPFFRD
ncbi:MAG: hypothetical protein J5781_03055, partial [Clostridia bacterium]|nr:hypothetical protein [Clostridia bacterium]